MHVTSTRRFNMPVAISISTNKGKDNIYFRDHIKEVCKNFHVSEWSGDTIYASREKCNAFEEVNGTPYFKLKDNFTAKPRGSPLWKRMVLKARHDLKDYDKHYHKRSNSENGWSVDRKRFGWKIEQKRPDRIDTADFCITIWHNLFQMGGT